MTSRVSIESASVDDLKYALIHLKQKLEIFNHEYNIGKVDQSLNRDLRKAFIQAIKVICGNEVIENILKKVSSEYKRISNENTFAGLLNKIEAGKEAEILCKEVIFENERTPKETLPPILTYSACLVGIFIGHEWSTVENEVRNLKGDLAEHIIPKFYDNLDPNIKDMILSDRAQALKRWHESAPEMIINPGEVLRFIDTLETPQQKVLHLDKMLAYIDGRWTDDDRAKWKNDIAQMRELCERYRKQWQIEANATFPRSVDYIRAAIDELSEVVKGWEKLKIDVPDEPRSHFPSFCTFVGRLILREAKIHPIML